MLNAFPKRALEKCHLDRLWKPSLVGYQATDLSPCLFCLGSCCGGICGLPDAAAATRSSCDLS